MKKVSLVVTERDWTASLEKLREVGVLHLERKNVSSDSLGALVGRRSDLGKAKGLLRRYRTEEELSPDASGRGKPEETVPRVLRLAERIKTLQESLLHQVKEKRRIEAWGNFDPADLSLIEKHGLTLIPYEIPLKIYDSLGGEVKLLPLSRDKRVVRALLVKGLDAPGGGETSGEAGDIPGVSPFAPPPRSLAEVELLIGNIKADIAAAEQEMAVLALERKSLDREEGELRERIEFETARAGMETLEEIPVESTISWITGFVPRDRLGVLIRAAAENGWALVSQDPGPDDRPPTLVKSNPAVRIVHPLFSFLGTVPGYREYDISNSYLIFFCLFFAMIFGDAAYGILLFAASLAAGLAIKSKNRNVKGAGFPDAAKLFMLLSFCTVAWGAATGSWFAAPVEQLPSFLRALIIPPFDNTGPLVPFPPGLRKVFNLPAEIPMDDLKTRWNIQFLCFTVGAAQLIWGRGKNVKKLLPSLTAFAQAGWLVMMIGLYFLVLFMLLKIPMPPFAVWLIGGGLVLYFIFAEQNGGNFFRNIGKSFSNFLSIFLNAVGSFADIISYIRLFAVGLAGSIIAQSFNSMAIPAGGFGGVDFSAGLILRVFAAALILIFGHGLNIVMNALSVVVHGVRLNLLEYAGNHLGMEWSGYAYNPFALRQKKNEI
ncbi:MAG: hypothetical protein LBG84_11745 [Treponema sp.]|jgi:V/A-type H+-transporting ATPase subunit I|nr:hypothetical protein [Treponema sp.]